MVSILTYIVKNEIKSLIIVFEINWFCIKSKLNKDTDRFLSLKENW